MDEFEAFRKLDTDWVKSNIESTIKKRESLHGLLSGKEAKP